MGPPCRGMRIGSYRMLLWLSSFSLRFANAIGIGCCLEQRCSCTADVPLPFAVKHLIREYRNCIATLQSMLDENRDLFVPLPNDHPVALGIPLPHSLLAPHRHFCDAGRAAIATIEGLLETWKLGLMILNELFGMRCVKPVEFFKIAATPTDITVEDGS